MLRPARQRWPLFGTASTNTETSTNAPPKPKPREAEGITSGRAKSVLILTKVEAVRTMRNSGKTIAYIFQNQAMSHASVYRALAENTGLSDRPNK